MVLRPSYLYNGNPYAGKTVSLYRNVTQFPSHDKHNKMCNKLGFENTLYPKGQGVFYYIWWVWITLFILLYSMCSKLDDCFAWVMPSYDLRSNTRYSEARFKNWYIQIWDNMKLFLLNRQMCFASLILHTPCPVMGLLKIFSLILPLQIYLTLLISVNQVLVITYFRIWGHVLHVEYVSCVITNCDQHQAFNFRPY